MQNHNSSDYNPPMPEPNISPTPTPGPPPAPYPYPSPYMPNEPAPAQYLPPSTPNGPAPAQYPYPSPSIPNGPAQYPYSSPYQQQYPAYPVSPTSNGIIQASLIGGAIACGIDTLITLLLILVPALDRATLPLYHFGPLLPSNMLSVGKCLISLIIALLCSPGFFVVGLQTIRKTGRTNAVTLAYMLALAGFVVIDLVLITGPIAYRSIFFPNSMLESGSLTIGLWQRALLNWFVDLIMMSLIAYAAASLGATLGKQPRY